MIITNTACQRCGNKRTNINMDLNRVYCGRCGETWKYDATIPGIEKLAADSRCPMCQGPTYFKKVCPACENDPRS